MDQFHIVAGVGTVCTDCVNDVIKYRYDRIICCV